MKPLTLYPGDAGPLRLRGHTLLCLQGFEGKGYSPEFVENLARIHRELADNHEQVVEVVDTPDAVCGACPHKAPAGCSLNGDSSEEGIQDQDRRVLGLLGLTTGAHVRWGDILDRIRASVSGTDLPAICGQCRWLPLGCCRDGIDRLRATQPAALATSRRRNTDGST